MNVVDIFQHFLIELVYFSFEELPQLATSLVHFILSL